MRSGGGWSNVAAADPATGHASGRSGPVWVILCHIEDEPALALATLLEGAGVDLTVLRPEDLVCATHVHRVGPEGASATALLRDGTRLDLASVTLLINRFRAVPEAHLERCEPQEHDYVRAEWSAFFASLLGCCGGPVLNPPFGDAPGGYPPGDIEGLHYAAACGLPVTARRITEGPESWTAEAPVPTSSHLVVGDAVLPDLPEPLAGGIRRLSRVLGLPLLQVDFAAVDGTVVFHGCSAEVEFRHAAGPALVAALHRIANAGGAP